MEYRILGKTGIKVSAIAMGCEGFDGKSAEAAEKMLDFAVEKGINFFDMYTSDPNIRANVGRALHRYPRENYVVQGHLCSVWKDGQYCRTRKIEEVKLGFEELLDQMQLSYVEIGMIHFADDRKDFETVMNGPVLTYALDLKKQGTIRHIGLSTHNPDIALLAAETGVIDVIMFSINPAYDMLPANEDINAMFEEGAFDRVYEGIDPKRSRLYQLCQNTGVALTVMKCYAGGLLLDEKQTPFGGAMTAVQCIHYCLTRPAVAAIMSGSTSIPELEDDVSYCTASEEQKDYSLILSAAPKRSFHGHCMYCGHCAPCSSKIDIADVNKYLDLAVAQQKVTETLRDHYRILERHGSDCTACGKCMKNCPFQVNIIEKMREATRWFGY